MSTIGGAVVNAAAVIILRSGRASDPRLVAGAFAIYTSAKRTGQLNGELFGNQLDQLLKSEYDIDVDKYLEEQLEQNIMPILEEYFGYKDTWTEWFDSLVEPDLTQSQDYPSFDDMVNYDSNNPNNFNPPTDTDGDGIPDSKDPYPNDGSPDSDGDGVPDNSDSHPNDPNQGSTDDNENGENGDGHPLDPTDFTPPRRDPLVLDLDKDGFIATTSLEDSTAYFDLTGDGIKEKVGWIQASDGLVAYDKNNNGKIDGIDEVFGNQITSGFDELRQIADSNHDGVIDRQDELYSRLKVWQDTNQDGISQVDELVGLKEADVKSINLNAVSTNIEVNGNIISEASKYKDSDGNLELLMGNEKRKVA